MADHLTIQCLLQTEPNTIQIENNANFGGNVYTFNGVAYDDHAFVGVNTGTYALNGIPANHPLAFVIDDDSLFEVTAGAGTAGTVGDVNVVFYTGNITFEVKGNFGTIDYYCQNHGAMGGTGRLQYSATCPVAAEDEDEDEDEGSADENNVNNTFGLPAASVALIESRHGSVENFLRLRNQGQI